MADTDPVVPDLRTMQIIERHIRQQMGQVKNRLLQEVFDAPQPKSEQWVPFINDSTAAVPGCALMAVSTGSTRDPELATNYLHCTQASTVYRRRHVVNSAETVEPGAGGLCALYGPVEVLYDETGPTPTFEDGYGPKPGSWKATKGYPSCCMVLGSADSSGSARAMYADLLPITALLGKTTGSITAGSSATTAYKIYHSATPGAPADAGFTTVPSAYYFVGSTISSDKWIQLDLINGVWHINPWECGE